VEPLGTTRPLTARSVIASTLLGMHPPRLSSACLVRWCSLFGVAEGTARVALSRMVERGELRADDGIYELAGSIRRRQPAQDWVLAPDLLPWAGEWTLAVVTADGRSQQDRVGLRSAARAARYGEVREGVWARPANLPRDAASGDVWEVLDRQCGWWQARPDDVQELVASLFDPAGWAARGSLLLARLSSVTGRLEGSEPALAEGFVAGAASLQHLRHDPLLPAELLPARWPGDALRAAYLRYQPAYAEAVARYLR
jgi:phenylacetic acid degradation operon negative regulatory protein